MEIEKLKTFKEFHMDDYCPQCNLSIPIFDVNGFRQESIKIIKRLRETMGKDFYCLKHDVAHNCCEDGCGCMAHEMLCNADYEASDSSGIIKFLMWRDGIKEEDLK